MEKFIKGDTSIKDEVIIEMHENVGGLNYRQEALGDFRNFEEKDMILKDTESEVRFCRSMFLRSKSEKRDKKYYMCLTFVMIGSIAVGYFSVVMFSYCLGLAITGQLTIGVASMFAFLILSSCGFTQAAIVLYLKSNKDTKRDNIKKKILRYAEYDLRSVLAGKKPVQYIIKQEAERIKKENIDNYRKSLYEQLVANTNIAANLIKGDRYSQSDNDRLVKINDEIFRELEEIDAASISSGDAN